MAARDRVFHRYAAQRKPTSKETGMSDEIRAEMVANVWKITTEVGAEVSEGDTLVILESMKMEIPVIAESDGTVSQIAVNEGDVVQEGDLIAVIG
jgi:acetyl-CoA carboxylase biotin carboxyl carrier protein